MIENANWQEWRRVRSSPLAAEAAKGGYSWSLRCAVLNDGKRLEQIDPRELAEAHRHAVKLAGDLEHTTEVWDRFQRKGVTFADKNRALALTTWRNLLVQEAETAEEIRRSA